MASQELAEVLEVIGRRAFIPVAVFSKGQFAAFVILFVGLVQGLEREVGSDRGNESAVDKEHKDANRYQQRCEVIVAHSAREQGNKNHQANDSKDQQEYISWIHIPGSLPVGVIGKQLVEWLVVGHEVFGEQHKQQQATGQSHTLFADTVFSEQAADPYTYDDREERHHREDVVVKLRRREGEEEVGEHKATEKEYVAS